MAARLRRRVARARRRVGRTGPGRGAEDRVQGGCARIEARTDEVGKKGVWRLL